MPAEDNAARSIDRNFATNLRTMREAAGLSQEELASRMAAEGFSFSQATIWKIEQLQRPVRLAEAAALAGAVGDPLWPISLHLPPGILGAKISLGRAHEEMSKARHGIKHFTRKFIEARRQFDFAVEQAQRAGVPEDDEIWIGVFDGSDWDAPEFLALEARYEERDERLAGVEKHERRNQLKRVWNKLVPEDQVVPPAGES
jgi:transcriptional regulator with XRE-family HTH domain